MANIPTVAIIGRPNTGKSRLFNRLIGRRKAIVSDVPGTTRDHIASLVEGGKVDYLLVDTGGMGGGTQDEDLEDDVHRQSLLALENADLILFTVNSQESLTASDMQIAHLLRVKRKRHVPVVLVVTKCDNPGQIEELLPQYYELKITDEIIPVSAIHTFGLEDLQQNIEERLTGLHFIKHETNAEKIPQIAVIGKPNVGKSSIINALMSEGQREKSPLLVSDLPGTTRDSTDTVIHYHDKPYNFIDTAGIKKRQQTGEGIETFAYFRSIQAVEECDIAILVLDSREPVSKQDKRIAGLAIEEGKGLIILLNKIDLITVDKKAEREHAIRREIPFCRFAPVIACSAVNRKGLLNLFDQTEEIQRNRTRRIATKELQNWYKDVVHDQPADALKSCKHITQADGLPPTFVLFVKNPKMVQVSQLRYLENRLRETFGFEGTPIRWVTKGNEG